MLTRHDSGATRGIKLLSGAAMVFGFTLACERPNPPAPLDLEAAAKLSKLAAAASAAAASAAASAAPPAPTLVEAPFSSEKPSSMCSPVEVQSCSLDMVQTADAKDATVVKQTDVLHFAGWGVDTTTSTIPPVLLVELVGKTSYFTTALRITKRPDVADVMKNPLYVDSGFEALAPMKDVAPGEYTARILQVNSVGASLVCNTPKKFKVE